MAQSDLTNSACDLHLPHKQVLAQMLGGQIDETTAGKWMEENFLEVERWVRFARLNSCFTTAAPSSACGAIYDGAVDSYTDATVTDTAAWDSTYIIGFATIVVHNNTGGAGLVGLAGGFTSDGTTLGPGGAAEDLIAMTLADGEKIKLTDVCTIQRGATSNGYMVTNLGATNVNVKVNVTFTETEAGQACCTGGG